MTASLSFHTEHPLLIKQNISLTLSRFSTTFLRFGNLHSSNTLSYPLPGLSLLRCCERIMHENLRPAKSALYTALKSIQDAKARLDLRDPFETTSISPAGGGSHVIPETPPSSDTEAVSSIVEQENVLEGDRWVTPSRSLADAMHEKLLSGALAASNKALASIERDRNPSDSRMEPLELDSSSTEARSQTSERITSQRRSARSSTGIGVAPPPRFINPAKITKSKDEERGTASYLNQQQLYMLRQQETRVVRKLESKSIPQLQMLQHKALTSRASNKIKNLIQNALFEKHMGEMKE
ncbi:hypothetical protein KCV07_g146, partial [Aureobasidium melanogenum]